MKTLIVISTGRCGTKRLTEILKSCLQDHDISVIHQNSISRLANILGNIMYYFGSNDWLKKWIYSKVLSTETKGLIITDPLLSMCIPRDIFNSNEVLILHVYREEDSFAKSMYNLTRRRVFSFIAHNFVPFWQISLWPLQNLINPNILKQYKLIGNKKNAWLKAQFGHLRNYKTISMEEVFMTDFIEQILSGHFNVEVKIEKAQLKIKSN